MFSKEMSRKIWGVAGALSIIFALCFTFALGMKTDIVVRAGGMPVILEEMPANEELNAFTRQARRGDLPLAGTEGVLAISQVLK